MTNTQDYSKMMQDMMASFPVDTKSMQDAFKTQAALGEKMSRMVLEAAEKSAEISNKWTKETLTQLGEASKLREEPTDYSKAVTDFASASAETAAENIAAFGEIAKRVQMDTIEVMLATGKDFSQDASAAMKKATAQATQAAKKATASATAK
ncbi:phasin family protein [Alkalilacustris brevis]|uniref:phasin family protein n=1 Tax=Alkalilacustris brevis TaxID=2026338 RepID=UPI000E0D199B|nr:phasin family protein [Alkalilacustris brevis]